MHSQLPLLTEPSDFDRLRDRLGMEWPAITRARETARGRLRDLLAGIERAVPPDASFVVYGSLARLEFTSGSDLDWTLLIDGPADPTHRDAEIELRARVAAMGFKKPNPLGSFGGLTFSHDLLHKIGGDDDTNRNTTQRILLLLESVAVGDGATHAAIIHNVLRRYIEEDLRGPADAPFRVPRFLLNDVARYWRTMAVDFAHKRRERAGAGWALRTIKLQMSRKMMYAAGLLSCYSVRLRLGDDPDRTSGATQRVVLHLAGLVAKTPLDIMAGMVLDCFGSLSVPAVEAFDAYDAFVALLDDEQRRTHLDALTPGQAGTDPEYEWARAIGTRFHEALTRMFFESDPLRDLTRHYGVF